MSPANSEQLTEEQKQLLKSLEEEFKDRYTENDEKFMMTLKEPPPLPPVVENWRDFRPRDDYPRERSRNRSGNRYRDDQERRRYGDRNSDRYPHASRSDYRYRERNHYRNQNRWD